MANIPPVAEGTYGARRILLYDTATISETRLTKSIELYTIQFLDDGEKRVVQADDPNIKLWIHYQPCDYCMDIEFATMKSPRKKYKFCPMCGRKRKEEEL